jgi:trimethylamine-N-oxide reductase (cytochrome c)
MSDLEAVGEIAKKVGMYDEFMENRTVSEWVEHGFNNSGAQDLITLD